MHPFLVISLVHSRMAKTVLHFLSNVGNGLVDEVFELQAQGIKVDDDNEPLDEGAPPPPPIEENAPLNFTIPTHCPHRERNMIDERGKWAHHCWDEIASMTEFELFRMTFPEDFVKDVIIPTTNNKQQLGVAADAWRVL
ncbi:hypothetical protein ACHAXA_009330 [Cyclostephanos tholiformis]|uniref:Uncharacterized protein n=1 Tax=Cyclostephanos tholiformis TaxID=382380 RepID=A0ABD3SQS9_9STRA